MKRPFTYRHTIVACCSGLLIQAVINNLSPLLFLTWEAQYRLSTGQIAFLITLNFGVQLLVDLTSAFFVPRLGLRRSIMGAHLIAALGLIGLSFLPEWLPPYPGLLIAVFLYAIGSGLIEVTASPIVEACPTRNKSAIMSLLHSFYCWGHVLTVLLSTLFFICFGTENWRILPCLWAVTPLANLFLLQKVPLFETSDETETAAGRPSLSRLCRQGVFWLLMALMLCSGAAEQGMAQWASAFAEEALHVNKTLGDLAGPCTFALLMGLARLLYSRLDNRLPLRRVMLISALFCVATYLLAALTHTAVFGLIGCGLCGFFCGIMWPGTLSIGARTLPGAGTAMFSMLALAGDMGCIVGPGIVSTAAVAGGNNLKTGLLFGAVFPLLLALCLLILVRKAKIPPQTSPLHGRSAAPCEKK